MDKIKAALSKLFEDKVDDGGLDTIIEMIEVKIETRATEKIEESLITKLDEESTKLDKSNTTDLLEYKELLAKTIAKYLEIGLNEFVDENQPKFESEIVVEMSKNMINGLATVLKENSINIPENEVDVVKSLEEEMNTMKTRLDTQINENIESDGQSFEYEKAIAFMSMTNTLALTQREKVQTLIESLECTDIESFKRKLTIIINEFKIDNSNININDLDPKEIDLKEEVVPGKTKADKLLV